MNPNMRVALLPMVIMSGLHAGCDGGSAKKIAPAAPLTGADLEAFEKQQRAIQEAEQKDREAGRIQ